MIPSPTTQYLCKNIVFSADTLRKRYILTLHTRTTHRLGQALEAPCNNWALVLYVDAYTHHGMMSKKRPTKRYKRALMFFAWNSDGKRPAMARRFRNLHIPTHKAHWNICIYKSESEKLQGCKLVQVRDEDMMPSLGQNWMHPWLVRQWWRETLMWTWERQEPMVFRMVQWMRKSSRMEEVLVLPLHGSCGSGCQHS